MNNNFNPIKEFIKEMNKKVSNAFKKSDNFLVLKYLRETNEKLMKINNDLLEQNKQLNSEGLTRAILIFNQKNEIDRLEKDKLKLESDNESLKLKVDNLVEELMKIQSYKDVK